MGNRSLKQGPFWMQCVDKSALHDFFAILPNPKIFSAMAMSISIYNRTLCVFVLLCIECGCLDLFLLATFEEKKREESHVSTFTFNHKKFSRSVFFLHFCFCWKRRRPCCCKIYFPPISSQYLINAAAHSPLQ